eukprot:162332-Rhodomonas_salina.1
MRAKGRDNALTEESKEGHRGRWNEIRLLSAAITEGQRTDRLLTDRETHRSISRTMPESCSFGMLLSRICASEE